MQSVARFRWKDVVKGAAHMVGAICVGHFISVNLYCCQHVQGKSMQPSLEDNDKLLVEKWRAYRPQTFQRGDIVILK